MPTTNNNKLIASLSLLLHRVTLRICHWVFFHAAPHKSSVTRKKHISILSVIIDFLSADSEVGGKSGGDNCDKETMGEGGGSSSQENGEVSGGGVGGMEAHSSQDSNIIGGVNSILGGGGSRSGH